MRPHVNKKAMHVLSLKSVAIFHTVLRSAVISRQYLTTGALEDLRLKDQ